VSTGPVETFPALDALPFVRAVFIQRCPGIDVLTDRDTALQRLWSVHRETADARGFAGLPFVIAEQVHGNLVATVEEAPAAPIPAVDGLTTSRRGLCLAIYVADCAPVYLVDKKARAIALVHSGKKGTDLGIVPAAIETLQQQYGCAPEDLIIQIGPCIRPPHYETDIAREIVRQARAAGVAEVADCAHCTAADPGLYYSYRREKGKTGRMLALLALV